MALGSTITQVTKSGLKPGLEFPSLVVSGILTSTNFKTGTTDVHSTGVTAATSVVGSAVTSNSTGIDVTGIVTATTFKGALTGDVTGNATGNARGLTGTPNITIGTLNASTGAFSSNVTISGNLGVAGVLTYEDVARVDAIGLSTYREGLNIGPLAGIALTAYKDGSIRSTGIITATSFSGGLPITSGVDNRVITASSASAIQGEANLTFDGNLLKLQCDSGEFRIEAANGVDAFSVDSDNGNTYIGGNVGINDASPDAPLHITGGLPHIRLENSGTSSSAGDVLGQIDFKHNDSDDAGVTAAIKCIAEDSAGNSYLTFNNGDGGNADERLRITSTGKIGVGVDPSSTLSVKDVTEFTAYANVTPSSTQCLMQLWNNPPNETTGDHASMQFAVNGGSHNRVNTISAVAESAGNRKLAFAFCTDEAGSRTEKMRITGDGQVTKPKSCAFNYNGNGNQSLNSGDTLTSWRSTDSRGFENSGTGGYLSSGVFTAPIAGAYFFTSTILLSGLTSNTNSVHVYWQKNGSGYYQYWNTRFPGDTNWGYGSYVPAIGATTMYMSAGDTCRIKIYYGGNNISFYAPTGDGWSHWSGFLIG